MRIKDALAFLALIFASPSWAREAFTPQELEFIAKAKKRAEQLNEDIKILRTQGPEAFYGKRDLKLDDGQRRAMSRDLMKIVQQKKAPRYSVDEKAGLLIVEDHKGRSAFDLRELRKGYLSRNSYQELRYAIERRSLTK